MRITRLPGSMWTTSGHGSPCECPGAKHGHDQLLSCRPRKLGQGYRKFYSEGRHGIWRPFLSSLSAY